MKDHVTGQKVQVNSSPSIFKFKMFTPQIGFNDNI